MVTQLQDVSNTVAQEKISNQRLRNEEIRRQMANPWSEPVEATQPSTSGRQPLQDVTKGTPTLASTYAGFLSNYQGMTGTSSNSGQTENNYNPKPSTGNPNPLGIPGWAPTVVGTGLRLAGAGIDAPIGAAFTSLMRGDRAGAAGTLAGLFTNVITEGKIPGLGGVVSSLASGLVKEKSATEMGYDISNSLLGTGLGMVNPALGLGYNLARMFGLDVSRGISDYSKSDINQRFDAGYNGGFWGGGPGNRGSWTPTAPYSPTNTYSGSGYGNTAGPGSGGYKGESSFGGYSPTMNYGSNSGSYWSGSSGYSSSNDSSNSGSWSSYSGGSAYS